MKNSNPAVQIIRSWLGSGQLQARPIESGGFTSLTKKQRTVFAASVESAARGILAIAEADPKGLCVCLVPEGSHFFPSCGNGDMQTVAVFNCDHLLQTELPGQEMLSPSGSLKVKALTLQCSTDTSHGRPAQLGIVVAPRSCHYDPLEALGYAAAFIDVHGDCMGRRQTPISINPKGYLAFTLGLQPMHEAVNQMTSGGHLDTALGFPMAATCLQQAVPLLEPYLRGLAVALAQQKVDLH